MLSIELTGGAGLSAPREQSPDSRIIRSVDNTAERSPGGFGDVHKSLETQVGDWFDLRLRGGASILITR